MKESKSIHKDNLFYDEEVEKKGLCDFIPDNRTLKSEPNGITPPIDGEYFVIKRGFIFRKSTVRMLNELKAKHPNENIYLSTIVDKALRHYHEYIFKENGSQN